MKLLNRFFAIFLILAFLNGCSSTKQNTPIVTTKTVVVVPPEELTRDCERPIPFSKEEYLKANVKDKEKHLIDLNVDQYLESAKCNKRLEQLRKWFIDQSNIYKK